MSPTERGCQTRCSAAVAAQEIRRAAMSPVASGGRIVEPVTEEDF
jgi:hypothetical protein